MRARFRTVLGVVSVGLLLFFCVPGFAQHTDWTPAQVHDRILAGGPLVILDVREYDEFCGGSGVLHIADAVNLPWNSNVLQNRYGELPTDRDIIVMCAAGGRSNQAATFLEQYIDPSHIFDMLGGMGAWTYETEACGTWPVLKLAKSAEGIEINWTPVTGTQDYDLLQGLIENIAVNGSTIDLGPIDCLAKTTPFTYFTDAEPPVSGHPSFYLVRQVSGSWGQATAGEERVPATTNCD
jgi:rhodanese-related sulfurtransferase